MANQIALLDDVAEAGRVLRERNNDLLPISRIPNELLGDIFITLRHDSTEIHGRKTPMWIALTHVYRRWRAAAIGYPLLWSVITLRHSLPWVAAFIDRSMSVLVDVKMDFQERSNLEDYLLSSLLPRTHALELEDNGDAEHIFLDHVTFPAPVLDRLVLSRDASTWAKLFLLNLHGTFFSGTHPCLRSIELNGDFNVTHVEPSLFEQLTSFSSRITTKRSVQSILSVLGRASNLESIFITEGRRHISGRDFKPVGDQIQLLKLKSIHLRGVGNSFRGTTAARLGPALHSAHTHPRKIAIPLGR